MNLRCLIGLGSNLGDRARALQGALDAIAALPRVALVQQSRLHATRPIGGPGGQDEFLNAAAVVETELAPLAFFEALQRIEDRFGRERGERWGARTLDVDWLLAGDAVIETPRLTVPHPRMSFRRFVLEPSAEIAGEMMHPTIGWTTRQLWECLQSPCERLVIVSRDERLRRAVAQLVVERCRGKIIAAPTTSEICRRWPPALATWIEMPVGEPSSVRLAMAGKNVCPTKLTIEVGGDVVGARPSGRGPTLTLKMDDQSAIEQEVLAAMRSAWGDDAVECLR